MRDRSKASAEALSDSEEVGTKRKPRGRAKAPPNRKAGKLSAAALTRGRRPKSKAESEDRQSGASVDPALLAIGKREKTMALQTALLEHGAEPAMILVILALMGATGTVRIRRSRPEGFARGTLSPEVSAVFEKYRPRFGNCLDEEAPAGRGLRLRYWEEDCQVRAFEALCRFRPTEMHELFAAFVASSLKTCSGYNAALGDSPLAAVLAREVNADVSRHWRLDSAYLKRCRKPDLVEIALAMGLPQACSPPLPIERLRRLTARELRQVVVEFLAVRPEASELVPAPLRFGPGSSLPND